MATLSSPTLQNILTSVRRLLNQPDPNNSFWRDEEITEYINEGIRIYFVEVSQTLQGYFTATTNLNIVANTETIALPTDCFEVRAVYRKQTDGYAIMPYRNSISEGYSTVGGTGGDTYVPYYFFQGNNLVLRPIPNFSETAGIKLDYLQVPDTLVNGGDAMTSQISPIFKQIIEMYAVYKAKLKESMVNGVIVHKVPGENLAELVAQFKNTIERRSKNPTFVIPFNPEEGF